MHSIQRVLYNATHRFVPFILSANERVMSTIVPEYILAEPTKKSFDWFESVIKKKKKIVFNRTVVAQQQLHDDDRVFMVVTTYANYRFE